MDSQLTRNLASAVYIEPDMAWRKGNRLRLVSEAGAQGRTRAIFDEFKQALGLPHVSVVYQAFAAYPLFLDLHWRALRPVLLTQEFFDIAARLRADAYTRVFNYLPVPDLCAQLSDKLDDNARRQLSGVVDLLQYKNPLLVLMVAAQFQAFDTPVGQTGKPTQPAQHPVYSNPPELVPENPPPAEFRATFQEIRRTLGLPLVSYDFRAMARWPEFFKRFWQVLKQVRESPLYEGSHHLLRETAWGLAREFPLPVDVTVTQLSDAGMGDDDIASVVRITEMFVQSLSGLLLAVSIARIALEGGTGAQATPETRPTAEPARPSKDKEQAA